MPFFIFFHLAWIWNNHHGIIITWSNWSAKIKSVRCRGHKYTTYCTCLISTLFKQHVSWINLLQTTSSKEEPQTYLYGLFTQWPQGLFGLSMTQTFKFMQMCTKLMQDARRMQTDPDCRGNLSKNITPSCYITYFMNVWKLYKEEMKCWMLLATQTDFVRNYTGHIFDCWSFFLAPAIRSHSLKIITKLLTQ